MSADVIEREVLIEAPVDVVWSVITDLLRPEAYHEDHSEGWSRFMVKIDEYAQGLVGSGVR